MFWLKTPGGRVSVRVRDGGGGPVGRQRTSPAVFPRAAFNATPGADGRRRLITADGLTFA